MRRLFALALAAAISMPVVSSAQQSTPTLQRVHLFTGQGGSDRGQMQKLSTRKFHGAVPFWSVKPLIIQA